MVKIFCIQRILCSDDTIKYFCYVNLFLTFNKFLEMDSQEDTGVIETPEGLYFLGIVYFW